MTGMDEYVASNGTRLLHTAWLLTGDRLAAEDLVRTALLKVWPCWPQIVEHGGPEGHLRHIMLTTYLSWRRRPGSFEGPTAKAGLPERSIPGQDHDLRLALLRALADLPRCQRATVVLRYYQDLSEAQTAAALGCSPGTVKSRTAKALRSIQARLGDIEMESHRD